MVYKSDSTPSKEGDKLKPWSKIAVFKLKAEEELAKIEGYVTELFRPHLFHVCNVIFQMNMLTRQTRSQS